MKEMPSRGPVATPAASAETAAGSPSSPQTGVAKGLPRGVASPDPEVVPKKGKRRRFSAEYKRRILDEADACTDRGEVGALLRREGLYSSHLASWRKQREQGTLAALSSKKRGRKGRERNPLEKRVRELEKEKARLEREAEKQRIIIEYQKKASEILGMPLKAMELDEQDNDDSDEQS